MRLTRQTGHAIRILIDCANAKGALVKVADIAKRLDLTKQNVFKIVHILARAGYLAPVRGPSGGVRLAAAAEEIRIGDVVRTIEVTDVRVGDEAHAAPHAGDGCVNSMLDDALGAFIAVLDQHTLADLAATGSASLLQPNFDKPGAGSSTQKRGPRGTARRPRSPQP